MRIITVANQKGGCGKTTVTINLAACLAREGQRTLAVDLDPQGHCALGLAVPEEQIEVSIADALAIDPSEEAPDLSRVIWQISSSFDLIPSRIDLAGLERGLAGVENRERRLRRALEGLREKYDFVIIDTPPTIGFLTESALFAADEVIVPVDTGYFSLHGLSKQLETLRRLRTAWGKTIAVRILANQYDVRTKLGREILAELRKRHGDAMFSGFVNFNTKLKESSSLGQPITEYDPASVGCRDFVRFAREVITLGASREDASAAMGQSAPACAPPLRPQVMSEDAPTGISAPTAPAPETASREKSLLERADALAADANRLLATTETLIGGGRAPQVEEREEPTPAQTHEKIEQIYGPRTLEDGVLFVVRAVGARRVHLAGSFNDWMPDRAPMQRVDRDTFQIRLPLAPGRHRYRYVIDGQWRNDPANHIVETNPYGELNNIVEVGISRIPQASS